MCPVVRAVHDVAPRPWNIASLCAGVGGLDLGIRIAEPGAHGVVHVEREAAAAAVLVARMEAGDMAPAPVWSDLATFDARPWRGVVDCVTALRRVADGLPHRVDRLRACGNGLVPLVAAFAWRSLDALLAAERAGIGLAEARLIDAEDVRSTPPPEALILLNTTTRAAGPGEGGPSRPAGDDAVPKHDDTEQPETNDPLIDLAADSLRGDIRDSLLAWFKAQPKSWPFMAEREQRDLADAADRFSGELITEACQIIAAGERPSIVAKLVEYKEKDGVEAKLKLDGKSENILALHEACGREVLIVTSGAEEFSGEAGAADIDPDQTKMRGIGDEYGEA